MLSYRKLPVFKVVLVHWYTSGPALLCLLYYYYMLRGTTVNLLRPMAFS